jgi:hypothetical protein
VRSRSALVVVASVRALVVVAVAVWQWCQRRCIASHVIHVVSNHGIFLDIYEWHILARIMSTTCNLQKTTNRRFIVVVRFVVVA